jgi:hypothetical protein
MKRQNEKLKMQNGNAGASFLSSLLHFYSCLQMSVAEKEFFNAEDTEARRG